MSISIFANPGQEITLAIQVFDQNGTRTDGYQAPQIDFVVTPSEVLISGFPSNMTKLDTGVYTYKLILPNSVIGTYLASASWLDYTGINIISELFLINVAFPFGNLNISPA